MHFCDSRVIPFPQINTHISRNLLRNESRSIRYHSHSAICCTLALTLYEAFRTFTLHIYVVCQFSLYVCVGVCVCIEFGHKLMVYR